MILAARAAELLQKQKSVLVVTFNITLLHYLMDVAVRYPGGSGRTRKDITWLNFHAWCRRICMDNDAEAEYKAIWKDANPHDVLNVELPALVSSVLANAVDGELYDAVLVDEGQDFLPAWWDVLRRVCKPGGEMLLVADETQDIYATTMLMAGMNHAFCAKQLGHSVDIFQRTYSKWIDGEQNDREMDRLELTLSPPKAKKAAK